jgi:hypothetical protein
VPAQPPSAPPEKETTGLAQTLVGRTNQLVDAYAECILHAAQHGLTVKPEDVRTLLVTAFINLSQRGRTAG